MPWYFAGKSRGDPQATQFTHVIEDFPEPLGLGSIAERTVISKDHVPVREPGHRSDALPVPLS